MTLPLRQFSNPVPPCTITPPTSSSSSVKTAASATPGLWARAKGSGWSPKILLASSGPATPVIASQSTTLYSGGSNRQTPLPTVKLRLSKETVKDTSSPKVKVGPSPSKSQQASAQRSSNGSANGSHVSPPVTRRETRSSTADSSPGKRKMSSTYRARQTPGPISDPSSDESDHSDYVDTSEGRRKKLKTGGSTAGEASVRRGPSASSFSAGGGRQNSGKLAESEPGEPSRVKIIRQRGASSQAGRPTGSNEDKISVPTVASRPIGKSVADAAKQRESFLLLKRQNRTRMSGSGCG